MNDSESAATESINDHKVKTAVVDVTGIIDKVIVVVLGKMCQDGADHARMADAVQTLCEARKVYSETVDQGTINRLAGAVTSVLKTNMADIDKRTFADVVHDAMKN